MLCPTFPQPLQEGGPHLCPCSNPRAGLGGQGASTADLLTAGVARRNPGLECSPVAQLTGSGTKQPRVEGGKKMHRASTSQRELARLCQRQARSATGNAVARVDKGAPGPVTKAPVLHKDTAELVCSQ